MNALQELMNVTTSPVAKEKIQAWIQKWVYVFQTSDELTHRQIVRVENVESLVKDSVSRKMVNGFFEQKMVNMQVDSHPAKETTEYRAKALVIRNGGQP